MGAVVSEEGVLKLVHPGRYVEILREPVIAADVMKKNPRHCITRPDVFEYPWIVVKPESVLNLGRVFFIVPNRTIYRLLKNRESCNRQQERQFSKSHHQVVKRTSPGMTPKHHQQQVQAISWVETSPEEEEKEVCGKSSGKQSSQVESCWPEMIVKYKETHLKFENNSSAKIRSFNDGDDHHTDYEHNKHVTVLKSCLRKDNSIRKLCQLKVHFDLPKKDEEQLQKRHTESQTEFPGFLHC